MKNKTANLCNYYQKWNLNEKHTTASYQKKKENLTGSTTLQANLASLLVNLDEEELHSHVNLNICDHNMDINDDDENTVLEDVNLPSFTEPYNNINYLTTNDDVSIFSFHEEEFKSDDDFENTNLPALIERTRNAVDNLSLSSGDVSIETPFSTSDKTTLAFMTKIAHTLV